LVASLLASALALVHAVAGTHAFTGISYLLLAQPLLAFMILPYYIMLPASMLLQVRISAVVSPTVTCVHALVLTNARAGSHALASVSTVSGSYVAGIVA
jgi:hypothetical protein